MQTIPSHSGAGGIVGVHYFSQVSWPVGFFIFAQLPNHSHYGLVWSLHQPISLWVVRHGLQLLHTKDLAHFVDYAAHEVSSSITQEPGWGSKDWNVTLIQVLAMVLAVWLGVNTCFVKWSWSTKMLATLGDWFSSKVVSMLVKSTCKRSREAVATIGCTGALDKLPSCCKQCT